MRVALVGDSHAQALWPLIKLDLEREGHDVVLTAANPGWSEAKYVEADIAAQLAATKPQVVVYELGGNNRDFETASYKATLQALVKGAKDAGASHVLWVGPSYATSIPFETMRIKTRALQKQLLPVLGVEWIDTTGMTQTGHRSDGVHFTTEGYATWAHQLSVELRDQLESLPAFNLTLWAGAGAVVAAMTLLIVRTLRRG